MTQRNPRSAAVALCFALPFAAGCATARTASPVVPGLALAPAVVRTDTVVFQRATVQNGQATTTGTRTAVLWRESDALYVEQRFPGGGGTIVDTAVADARTWRALAHRSHQPAKVMRFQFADGRATGTVAERQDSARAVSQELGGAIFDSNVLEWVVAALPLADGFHAEVPFFIYERGGRVAMPVAVQGREAVDVPWGGSREAWVVTVGVPGAPATIWVDTATRAVLRTQYDVAARGMKFVDTRVTPF